MEEPRSSPSQARSADIPQQQQQQQDSYPSVNFVPALVPTRQTSSAHPTDHHKTSIMTASRSKSNKSSSKQPSSGSAGPSTQAKGNAVATAGSQSVLGHTAAAAAGEGKKMPLPGQSNGGSTVDAGAGEITGWQNIPVQGNNSTGGPGNGQDHWHTLPAGGGGGATSPRNRQGASPGCWQTIPSVESDSGFGAAPGQTPNGSVDDYCHGYDNTGATSMGTGQRLCQMPDDTGGFHSIDPSQFHAGGAVYAQPARTFQGAMQQGLLEHHTGRRRLLCDGAGHGQQVGSGSFHNGAHGSQIPPNASSDTNRNFLGRSCPQESFNQQEGFATHGSFNPQVHQGYHHQNLASNISAAGSLQKEHLYNNHLQSASQSAPQHFRGRNTPGQHQTNYQDAQPRFQHGQASGSRGPNAFSPNSRDESSQPSWSNTQPAPPQNAQFGNLFDLQAMPQPISQLPLQQYFRRGAIGSQHAMQHQSQPALVSASPSASPSALQHLQPGSQNANFSRLLPAPTSHPVSSQDFHPGSHQTSWNNSQHAGHLPRTGGELIPRQVSPHNFEAGMHQLSPNRPQSGTHNAAPAPASAHNPQPRSSNDSWSNLQHVESTRREGGGSGALSGHASYYSNPSTTSASSVSGNNATTSRPHQNLNVTDPHHSNASNSHRAIVSTSTPTFRSPASSIILGSNSPSVSSSSHLARSNLNGNSKKATSSSTTTANEPLSLTLTTRDPSPTPTHSSTSTLYTNATMFPSTGIVVSEMDVNGCRGYAFDRGNGQYTRLIPVDVLPAEVQGIPRREYTDVGLIVLPVPRLGDLGDQPGDVQLVSHFAGAHSSGDPTGAAQGGLTDTVQTRIDNIIAGGPNNAGSGPVVLARSGAAASGSLIPGLARREKIYCDKWIHDGTCAFTQQGCKFLHDMPADKETQVSVGLFTGLPNWYRRQQADQQMVRYDDRPVPLGGGAVGYGGGGAPPMGRGDARFGTNPGGAFNNNWRQRIGAPPAQRGEAGPATAAARTDQETPTYASVATPGAEPATRAGARGGARGGGNVGRGGARVASFRMPATTNFGPIGPPSLTTGVLASGFTPVRNRVETTNTAETPRPGAVLNNPYAALESADSSSTSASTSAAASHAGSDGEDEN